MCSMSLSLTERARWWIRAGFTSAWQIVINQPVFNDIVNNGLYSIQGQQAFCGRPEEYGGVQLRQQ